MGYEIHIQRGDDSAITLQEWCDAVDAADGVRLSTEDVVARNPATGEEIRIGRRDGDAQVYFSDDDAWVSCLHFSQGRISFRPGNDFDDKDSPFRRALVAIAAHLDAKLVGDEGETYD
ncbi:hypothetical protein [Rhodopirellula europaea]|jgi:hypothetical protein|uniref:Integron gene cassette protein n=1 Tax=Rhodopirellula europaea SH398 TaxID=1263868 RepID=M5RYC7_9BACT|nr:hypothetical protein [Rhodopirellula europaea]EMI24358.1 hypothetical protein RESH_05057 [Rhodopirellula europaea SH398]